MSKGKVLVAYGTRYGSARIVAGDIEEYLREHSFEVVVVDLRKQSAPKLPGDFDLVIAGSSIAMFSWVRRVKTFLRKCRRTGVPTAVYITSGMAIDEPEKSRERFLDKIIDRIGLDPVLTLVTGPVIDFRPAGLPAGLKGRISGTIKAMAKDGFEPDGLMDMRDKKAFDEFLKSLTDHLA